MMGFLNKLSKTVDIWLKKDEDDTPIHAKEVVEKTSSKEIIHDKTIENENELTHYQKGIDFEKYVVDLFLKRSKYFVINDWTNDIYDKRKGIKVESNKNPDLVVRYKPTDEKIAIECKYRSKYYQNHKVCTQSIKWSNPHQIKQYKTFESSNNIPVFIVIGVGGKPDNPEDMFCIPLDEAKYSELFESVLKKFERKPNEGFFWKNGILK